MKEIEITHAPRQETLNQLGVKKWPIWTKDISEFSWFYESSETCYFLEGEAEVTPQNGEPVRFGKGDLVVFPKGMSCVWKVLKDVKKHYKFD